MEQIINELTKYVKGLISKYELEKAQQWQIGYSEGWKQCKEKYGISED